jgi:CRISPR system Cascade subunit CasD
MSAYDTLLFRLIGPMQAWGYRSRFEDRDTALEPTRSGVLGLLASACGVGRDDRDTLARWDELLRFGVRVDVPKVRNERSARSGFRLETDFHTAQNVLRAAGKGTADTVLSQRHYLADARFTVGVESLDQVLLRDLEDGLKNPCWTLSLGRKSFPLALPPWLPGGGIRKETRLEAGLQSAPFALLTPFESLPETVTFVVEPDQQGSEGSASSADGIPMRLADRPLDFDVRRFGMRQAMLFQMRSEICGMEEDRCFSQK